MASITFYGHETMTYPHYIDLGTGKTLVCQPGQTYNVVPASGSTLSAGTTMPNDGRFAAGKLAAEPEDLPENGKSKGRTPAEG